MHPVKFQDHLKRSFIRYACGIIAGVVVLFLTVYTLNFYFVIIRSSRQNNQLLSRQIESQYMTYAQEIEMLSDSAQIRTTLKEGLPSKITETNQLLYDFSNSQEFHSYFLLLDSAMQPVCSNFNRDNQSIFAGSAFVSKAISRLNKNPKDSLCLICTAQVTSAQKCCYSLCRAIIDDQGDALGWLFFNLREESFRDCGRSISQHVLITDAYDNVIYTTIDLQEDPQDKLPFGKAAPSANALGIASLDGRAYYLRSTRLAGQNIHVYTLTALENQIQTLWYSGMFFLLLAAVLTMIVVKMTRTFAQTNTREVGELMTAVDQLGRGNTDYRPSPQTSQEFQDLYGAFQHITVQMQELARHNSELVDRRRRMEIRQLEEQFNPHFVFNIMETVRYQIAEDPDTASDMLVAFARLMRYSIDHAEATVSLETDVAYINDFLMLQKIRYNQCLSYDFDIPDELLDCRVPKLLLQPVVENSIKHGYCKGSVLHVEIIARQEGTDLQLLIRDDGAGIPAERLATIRESFLLELDNGVVTHIGLYNLEKMLSLLYGENYGIRIDSIFGQGTCVEVTIPCEIEV